jgi:DNA adenine methylase
VVSPVWERLGADVKVYLEPFCGSAAMLLGRPASPPLREVLNDINGFVCNFYRALRYDPKGLLEYMEWPTCELDQRARNKFLIDASSRIVEACSGDPEYYDLKVAGWWCWGQCTWLGDGWANASTRDVRQVPRLPHTAATGPSGVLIALEYEKRLEWLTALSARLRYVTITCGQWIRILGTTTGNFTAKGTVGVFMDPPYPDGDIDYTDSDEGVHADVQKWCIERGNDPWMRIALCGYEEHEIMADHGWTAYHWNAISGGSLSSRDGSREVIWFSPHCIQESKSTLGFLTCK